MKKFGLCTIIFVLFCVLAISSCNNGSEDNPREDGFDRAQLLADLADDLIIPGYNNYIERLDSLVSDKEKFLASKTFETLRDLRNGYLNASRLWQLVAMYEIGKAEEINLRNYTNLYPTDVDLIMSNIENGGYNLELPSNNVAQGFPALDYLFFGTGADDSEILQLLSEDKYSKYLDDLITRLQYLAVTVRDDWTDNYREAFVANDGSSGTASVDKIINDFLFYFEKFFRAGKIGIPAGVFSGSTIPDNVEAPFSERHSYSMFFHAMDGVLKFLGGSGLTGVDHGETVFTYLVYLESEFQLNNPGEEIKEHLLNAYRLADELELSFKEQVETDNSKMLAIYDELQKCVVLMKVDMMQSLNIQVDYVDADGD